MENEEELAIIKNPGYGLRDTNYPCLFFEVCGEGWGSLQTFRGERAQEIITEAGVYDVKNLEGKPCIITINKDRVVNFVRMAKI